jgi:Activator of Hsp90 ATPase homolog 1-like protein
MTAPDSPATPPSAPRVVVDVTIAAPIERVWQALRDPALLAQWFGWDYDKLAAEIEMIFLGSDIKVEPGRRLDMGGDVFELEAVGSSTRVRLVRAEAPTSDTWDGVYDDIDEGWRTFVAQLAFWLEAQQGVDRAVSPRRTIYLAGHREQADGPSLAAAAGLSAIADLPVGERYATTAVTGEPLAGVVRFRTEHQVGFSVDAWGPGMLVLAGRPGSPKSPHGGGFALITAFGVTEDALARIADGWSAAWRGAFTRVSGMP